MVISFSHPNQDTYSIVQEISLESQGSDLPSSQERSPEA